MNKKNMRQKSLRGKLIAAVAMLLVACVMMVSSTYAWFTLSTSPEVQGITTTIGANGNLEIALSPASGDPADITSGIGDTLGACIRIFPRKRKSFVRRDRCPLIEREKSIRWQSNIKTWSILRIPLPRFIINTEACIIKSIFRCFWKNWAIGARLKFAVSALPAESR